MLTEEQILENKLRYFDLLTKLDVDLTAFTKYLDNERVDFFTKPYNNYSSCAYFGSLCEHSLLVYDELVKLANIYFPDVYKEKDLIMTALFKDLYRAELYEPYVRNVKNEQTDRWEQQLAFRAKEVKPIFGDIGFSSYMIARKFFNLSNDEVVEAICYSNNAEKTTTQNVDLYSIRKNYKLTALVTMAEFAVLYLSE